MPKHTDSGHTKCRVCGRFGIDERGICLWDDCHANQTGLLSLWHVSLREHFQQKERKRRNAFRRFMRFIAKNRR